MRVQTAVLIATTCLLAFTPGRLLIWVSIGILLVAAGTLHFTYRRKLAGRPRAKARIRCDREVVRQVAALSVAPAVCGLAATAHGGLLLWSSPRLTVGAAAFSCFWLAVYVSSLVDWYYVRPRRDGVVVPPPCRNCKGANWTSVTRGWWANRCLVVLVCYVAGVASAVSFGLAALGDTGDSRAAVGSLVVAGVVAATGAIRLFYGNLAAVGEAFTSCFISSPDIALGDILVGPPGFVGGYVRDIALEGITVVTLEADGRPRMKGEKPATKRHPLAGILNASELETRRFSGCEAGCSGVNEHCAYSPLPRPRE